MIIMLYNNIITISLSRLQKIFVVDNLRNRIRLKHQMLRKQFVCFVGKLMFFVSQSKGSAIFEA